MSVAQLGRDGKDGVRHKKFPVRLMDIERAKVEQIIGIALAPGLMPMRNLIKVKQKSRVTIAGVHNHDSLVKLRCSSNEVWLTFPSKRAHQEGELVRMIVTSATTP
jgi:hypothetical protein